MGKPRLARLLIASGADMNITDKFGHTPLFKAMHTGMRHRQQHRAGAARLCRNVARLLVERRADVAIASSEGVTPLALAKKQRDKEMVALILKTMSNGDGQRSRRRGSLSRRRKDAR